MPTLKKAYKIFLKILLSVLMLIVVLWILLQTSFFQNFIVGQVTKRLSKNLNTTVSIRHIDLQLFDKMSMDGLLILDHKKDTLLYAGSAKVDITDWFFFRDNITLKYIGLDDALVNMNRTDSVWNYQFMVDYFSSPKKKQDTSKNVIHLDLKTVHFKNVKFWQKDGWKGVNTLYAVGEMNVQANRFDLANNVIDIATISLYKPIYSKYDYTGTRPELPVIKKEITGPDSSMLQWNTGGWRIQVKNINLKDGNIALEREGGEAPINGMFDTRHIVLSSLNGSLKNVELKGDTLRSAVNISLKDRGGFVIKKLSTDYVLTPTLMEFNQLDLVTEKSQLRDYYAMHYQSFSEDMSDFIHAVKLEGRFKNSIISSDDIAYFAPETASWKTDFKMSGEAYGKIDNLSARKMIINAGGTNFLDGDISLKGLPDINETFIDFRSRLLRTSYGELSSLFPSLRGIANPRLSAFGNMIFIGSYTGYIRDFVAYGTLSTDIGLLKTDLHLQIPGKGRATYNGTLSTDNFQLGKFINNSQLGNIAFDGKIDGKGFSENEIQVLIDGNIRNIGFNNYTYKNIIAHGELDRKLFTGTASVHDDNVIIDTLVGSINFSKKDPRFNLSANIDRFNLRQLGFSKDTISLTGNINFDFTGSNIDNFLGSARLYNAVLIDNAQHLSFDSLFLNSSLSDGNKLLTLTTNELEASINGDFKILELPEAFQLFLNKYYPAYINKPLHKTPNQNFTFQIKTREISDYLNLFNRKITGLDNSVISGDINVAENKLNLIVDVPQFKFGNISFNDTHLSAIGTQDTLSLVGEISDVIINDSLHSPETKFRIVAANDISDVTINATANKAISAIDLSARVETNRQGFMLTFNPSTFTINKKTWNIQKAGTITLADKILMAKDVRLTQDDQEIVVSTEPSETNNSNDLVVSLKSLVIEDLTPMFLKTPQLGGLLSGKINVGDLFGKTDIKFNTKIDQFKFEGDSIGIIKANGQYMVKSAMLTTNVVSENELYNFKANLGINTNDSIGQINGAVVFNKSGIHILEKYLGGIFSNIYGRATGTLNIIGTTADPKLTGKINLDETSLTVDYTKCRYVLADNSVITFKPDNIDFGNIRLIDTLNNTATLTGSISHHFFDNFYFNNLHMVTDEVGNNRGRFILLNTTSADNNQFYGNMIGKADMSINGPISDMVMNITGEPTDSSHIYLPIGESAETGTLDYIEFIKYGREMKADLRPRENTNIKVNMEINANPLAKVDVILDETTGDVIKAQGTGKLLISAGTRDPLTIRGRYDIEQGEYTFNFQTFLKTPFTLQQGYIEWQGDPYLANLNLDAIYRAQNVILNNIPTSTGIANTRGDVDILFKLRGTLKDPKPGFEFQFPFNNPLKSDPIANEYLKTRYQSDNNQLLNQVASLLLFNTFMNNDQGLLTSNNTGNFVTKTVGQLLSTTLSASLNTWLQKLLNTNSVNLYTNINTSDFNFQKGGTQKEIQNVGNFGVKKGFLNNKLLVTVGGNVDYRLTQNTNSNFLFTPDVSFEYLITPDGRFRVIGFNRSDADPGDLAGITRRNRTGIQLSYRKDFDTFEEFFTNRRRRARQ
ncbi:MAG: translocation/assembly module TamB domain-containing protein [Ginsengibacter sp.]